MDLYVVEAGLALSFNPFTTFSLIYDGTCLKKKILKFTRSELYDIKSRAEELVHLTVN